MELLEFVENPFGAWKKTAMVGWLVQLARLERIVVVGPLRKRNSDCLA
jgi:hypothetical protein